MASAKRLVSWCGVMRPEKEGCHFMKRWNVMCRCFSRVLKIVLSVSLLAACSPAFGQERGAWVQRPRWPEGTQVYKDLEYVLGGHERQKLDIYVPPAAEGAMPLIVWVHGGAWQAGSKDGCPALRFLAEGYVVASINYRLSQHAIFPAQIIDCKAAIRYLRANAAKYHIDPERIGVWGASAGGHLVALLGTTGDVTKFDEGPNLEQPSRVQAVCDFFGPTDFLKIGDFGSKMDHYLANSPASRLIGGPVKENDKAVQNANPITYVSKDDPPFLIVHGDADPLVPHNQSELLQAALEAAGVKSRLHIVKGGGHGFNDPEVNTMVERFFARTLKGERARVRPQ